MKRRLFALALALLLAVSLPVSALARDWYIDEGDITIRATENGQTVSQGDTTEADDAPVIKQRDSSNSTDKVIKVIAEKDATANVTLDGVNIDTSKNGMTGRDQAALRTEGDGDVNIELDGDNYLKSSFASHAAGLNKGNSGTLTINDEDNSGKLEATGGYGGAGIGGGYDSSTSDITITGGTITARGSNSGAGIGGGNHGNGSNITISGGDVTAMGGTGGAGIGGGRSGTGSDITISGDAQVKSQGGTSNDYTGAGAGIGNGGTRDENEAGEKVLVDGVEVEPDTSGLTENGRLEYYAPGADMENDAPKKVIENKPETEPEPSGDHAQPGASAPVYSVTDKDGNAVSYTAAREGGVLTIRVDAAFARLTLTADEAQALTAQGVEKVIFVTTSATSAFRPADLTAYKDEAPFVLTHDGETVTFTAGETDLASLLLQA